MTVLTHDHLLLILSYSKESGNFVWLIRYGRAHPGKIAGTVRPDGYVVIGIDGKRYKAHRLAWFYVNGKWPRGRLDHGDNCGSNNRWVNLRRATHSQNMANRKLNDNSSTGFKGVYEAANGRFRAHVQKKGRRFWVGTYATALEAAAAASAKSIELHGAFARRA